MTRALALCLALLPLACAHAPPPPPAPPAPAGAFDPAVLGRDAPGLAAAAERLCALLTTSEQKSLGLALAQQAFKLDAKAPGAALALAHCAAVSAEREADGEKLLALAQAGVEAARALGAPAADPVASYWMAVSLGLSLQRRGFAAIAQLPDEQAALKTAQGAPELELGGPIRALAMLYLKAPSWPAGPGDPDQALELLKAAVERYPSHPLNHAFLAQALRAAGDAATAAREDARAAELARPELWGDDAAKWRADHLIGGP